MPPAREPKDGYFHAPPELSAGHAHLYHMVVGNGMIAKAFADFRASDRYLFFCSGVSNSTSKDPADYSRETALLQTAIHEHPDKQLLYFSTCSIGDPSMQESMYVAHKRRMEAMIQSQCRSYGVFRLSNVVGRTPNAFTILNFLVNAVRTGERFRLWTGSTRNLIDIDDVAAIVKAALQQALADNRIINVANPQSYLVPEIVRAIEAFLQQQGNYEPVDVGADFAIDTDAIAPLITALDLAFGDGYLDRLLHKYYQP
jgi:nucleoside-diphosphate-sugar epimerase